MDILTLINGFANGLMKLQEKFMEQNRFDELEKAASELGTATIAQFLKLTLEETDELIRESGIRRRDFNVQRRIERTLITTVGDVTFSRTQFKSRSDGSVHFLLDELMGLPPKERFSEQAEAKVLGVASERSYQKAADSLKIREQSVSKVTVMEKVHAIRDVFRGEEDLAENRKKWCDYLYIEADEDHIHEQGGEPGSRGFMGKLIYIYEGKEDLCKGKRKLISPHYCGGLYRGSDNNSELWESVQRYIEGHYNTEILKCVYISGDGANWIRAGVDHVDKSVFVLDRFHLMKYINSVANLTLDDKSWAKGKIYKYIYQDKPVALKKFLTRIKNCCGGEEIVESCRTYLIENWEAVQRTFHDKHLYGCSAEGHVSHVYSERMSSRPMGWGETGSDSMCHLRCYVRNHGKEKIIDLVRYRREQELARRKMTGTEDILEATAIRKHRTKTQKEIGRYWEKMQVSIGGDTVRKTLAIRERIAEL